MKVPINFATQKSSNKKAELWEIRAVGRYEEKEKAH